MTAAPLAPIHSAHWLKWFAAPEPTPSDLAVDAASKAGSNRLGGERRGNWLDRRRRKLALLREFGDGRACRCAYCPEWLTVDTLTQDRIYRACGYRLSNLLPACFKCNRARSDHPPYVGRWDEAWWIARGYREATV